MSEDNNLVNSFKKTKEKSLKVLKVLKVLPYERFIDKADVSFIENAIGAIVDFQTKKQISQKDINELNSIIDIFDLENLFQITLSDVEKDFCEKEIEKYLDNNENYLIPNFEQVIDNGSFLKAYIDFKIDQLKDNSKKQIKSQ